MKAKLFGSVLLVSALFSPFSFGAEPNTSKKDGEVIAWIAAIDSFEIAAAEVASRKTVDPLVKGYADTLYSQHADNLKQTISLSDKLQEKPVETDDLSKFVEGAKKELDTLRPLDDNKFQTTYVDAMVTGHEDALKKVDNDLMKMVSNAELKTHLKATRDMIAHHLEEGKEIKNKLNIN